MLRAFRRRPKSPVHPAGANDRSPRRASPAAGADTAPVAEPALARWLGTSGPGETLDAEEMERRRYVFRMIALRLSALTDEQALRLLTRDRSLLPIAVRACADERARAADGGFGEFLALLCSDLAYTDEFREPMRRDNHRERVLRKHAALLKKRRDSLRGAPDAPAAAAAAAPPPLSAAAADEWLARLEEGGEAVERTLGEQLALRVLPALAHSEAYGALLGARLWALRTRLPCLDDFVLYERLGVGGSGLVLLARLRTTGGLYALKVMSKLQVARLRLQAAVYRERQALLMVNHPGLVRVRWCFQTSTLLCVVMEYVPGGNMYRELRQHGPFSTRAARLYAAQLVLAVAHLHAHGLLYRDLKPDNVLLAPDGRCILTDLGTVRGLEPSGAFGSTPAALAATAKQPPVSHDGAHGGAGQPYRTLAGGAPVGTSAGVADSVRAPSVSGSTPSVVDGGGGGGGGGGREGAAAEAGRRPTLWQRVRTALSARRGRGPRLGRGKRSKRGISPERAERDDHAAAAGGMLVVGGDRGGGGGGNGYQFGTHGTHGAHGAHGAQTAPSPRLAQPPPEQTLLGRWPSATVMLSSVIPAHGSARRSSGASTTNRSRFNSSAALSTAESAYSTRKESLRRDSARRAAQGGVLGFGPDDVALGARRVEEDPPPSRPRPALARMTITGTHGYRAPEVFEKWYGPPADYWTIGLLIGEMLLGKNIYRGGDKHASRRKLFDERPEEEIDEELDDAHAIGVIRAFLERDPAQRLGSEARGGLEGIMAHPFFAAVDWDALAAPDRRPLHPTPRVRSEPPSRHLHAPFGGSSLERISAHCADVPHLRTATSAEDLAEVRALRGSEHFDGYEYASPMLLCDDLEVALDSRLPGTGTDDRSSGGRRSHGGSQSQSQSQSHAAPRAKDGAAAAASQGGAAGQDAAALQLVAAGRSGPAAAAAAAATPSASAAAS